MMVNAAIFTCNICGEASANICAYCTKDACGNHRCERCKRCSDCCECEFPLSAEEVVPAAEIVTTAAVAPTHEVVLTEAFVPPEAVLSTDEALAAEIAAEIESAPPESLPVEPPMSAAPFLTPEESSVFSEPYIAEEPRPKPPLHWPPPDRDPSE